MTRATVVELSLPLIAGAQTSPPGHGIRHAATRGLTLVVRADGSVMGWGRDANGQPATPASPKRVFTTPLPIDRRSNGETGDGSQSRLAAIGPTRVSGLDGIKQIAADGSHNLALRSDAVRDDGSVRTWGRGTSAMTGHDPGLSPDDAGGRVLVPAPVTGVTGARRLSIGAGHVAVLLADGTVRLWGLDGYGQTGVGTSGTSSETDAYKRTPVKPAIPNVASIYLGGYRSIAVRADGTLWIWGGTSSTGSGILGRNLRVPTLLDLESFK